MYTNPVWKMDMGQILNEHLPIFDLPIRPNFVVSTLVSTSRHINEWAPGILLNNFWCFFLISYADFGPATKAFPPFQPFPRRGWFRKHQQSKNFEKNADAAGRWKILRKTNSAESTPRKFNIYRYRRPIISALHSRNFGGVRLCQLILLPWIFFRHEPRGRVGKGKHQSLV